MQPLFVLDACRTPVGRAGGALRGWHPVELLATVTARWADAGPLIVGCATLVGEQAINIARSAALASGWDESTSAVTLDAQGASGAFTLAQAAGALSMGAQRCVVGAVESMSRVPVGASTGVAVGKPFGSSVHARYADDGGLRSPGDVAEALAAALGLDRADLDRYAEQSRERAKVAASDSLLIDVEQRNDRGAAAGGRVSADEFTSAGEDLAAMAPIFHPQGLLTAATFAGPGDGAAGLLLAHEVQSGEEPLGRIIGSVTAGAPVLGGSHGLAVMESACKQAGVRLDEVDRFEVIEDSAVTPLAVAATAEVPLGLINPDGGALATGLPLGAEYLIRLVKTLGALRRSQQRYGVVMIAGANSIQAATLVEAL